MSRQLKTKIVHMKLRLRRIFQLSRSFRGYTVGTIVGFWVMAMEALAPWRHHQIPQWHP
jgi:hypothetical protein